MQERYGMLTTKGTDHIARRPDRQAAERTTTRRAGGQLAAFAVGMVAAFFGVAGDAVAGSANTDQFRRPGASTDTVQAKFRAYAGENNDVKVSRETYPPFPGYDWVEFRDRVPFHAWWGVFGSHGCDHGQRGAGPGFTHDPLFARCGHWSEFDELKLDLGDGNDRLQVHPSTTSKFRIDVEGKDGNDDIYFRDGAGADSADCGPGIDWAFGDPGDTRANCENESLGDHVTSDSPAVVSRGTELLDVFVRGLNNGLLTRRYDGNSQGWSPVWETVPGGLTLTSAPAAVWRQGQIDVFARGPDNALWHTWRENGTWVGRWESLGGVLTSAPTVASWAPGRLDVFVRGSDNRLHQRSCDIKLSGNSVCDGNDWSGWQAPPVGGGDLGSAPAAVSWGKGRIDVFTRGTDSQVYHVTFTARFRPDGPGTDTFDGGNWGPGWVPLGGQTGEAPAVASPGAGSLYLFVRGTDGVLYRQKFANGAWGGTWAGRGGSNARFQGSPAAVQASTNEVACPTGSGGWLHVFLHGGAPELGHVSYDDYGGWTTTLHHLRDCPD